MTSTTLLPLVNPNSDRIAGEQKSQRLVTAFILSGIFFMLLPGTFLGMWNLVSISHSHEVGMLPQAWLQAHGQAQIFGWIGSFILGIGFYSLTKMQSGRGFPARAGWTVWVLWTGGVTLRWLAGVTGWNWKVELPVSAVLQLAAFILFFISVRRHRPQTSSKPEVWMRLVAAASAVFLLTLAANCGLAFWQMLTQNSPALPHVVDQEFVVLAVWGILVPTIWGFNARWLPVFAGLEKPHETPLLIAYAFSLIGIVATLGNWLPVGAVAFLIAALLAIDALRVWEHSVNPPKLLNIHPSFVPFLRIAYGWLLISCLLSLLAVPLDQAGGFWGASRHALTVGFAAGMVFVIGPRILPAFCGMRVLWSKRLMFWSLLLLSSGCFLRIAAEPLAYEGLWSPAWKILPYSAGLEMAAVSLFALNIGVTLCRPPAHLLPKASTATNR
ncbi:MAG: hypothetical protein ABI197_06725 [Granulicella sp.]